MGMDSREAEDSMLFSAQAAENWETCSKLALNMSFDRGRAQPLHFAAMNTDADHTRNDLTSTIERTQATVRTIIQNQCSARRATMPGMNQCISDDNHLIGLFLIGIVPVNRTNTSGASERTSR